MEIKLKQIDKYIIKKFLSTYFMAIVLIIAIAVVFDFSEKVDNFIDHNAPVKLVITQYYFNFIPYFANLFSPLFTFIAVIFFTSKMAYNSEIIAILSGGVSYRRMMFPYFVSALIIAVLSFFLMGYIIPPANLKRLEFEDKYVKPRMSNYEERVHIESSPNVYVYINHFDVRSNQASDMVIENIVGGKLLSRTSVEIANYLPDSNRWQLRNYKTQTLNPLGETITAGSSIDSAINIEPKDFVQFDNYFESLNNNELSRFIKEQKDRGVGNIEEFVLEKYKRYANPFSAFILTLIGVSISSRKVRGGTGLHMGIGLLLSFSYILFVQVSNSFATKGNMAPLLAVWIPNIAYTIIGIYLYIKAPK